MVPTPLPTDMDTEPMEPTPTLTTERGPLMLSLRLMLRPILLSSMAPMDIPMPVSTVDTEPMVPTLLPTDMDTEPMEPTPIHTTARGPLMVSPRLRLMLRLILLFSMAPMDIPMPVPMVDTGPMVPTPLPTDMDTEPMEPTPTLTTERGPLMLRLTLPSSTTPMDMASPMLVSMLVSPLDPALVLTPSPRDLMLPPRDLPPTTDTPDMAGESKSFSRECNCQTNFYL